MQLFPFPVVFFTVHTFKYNYTKHGTHIQSVVFARIAIQALTQKESPHQRLPAQICLFPPFLILHQDNGHHYYFHMLDTSSWTAIKLPHKYFSIPAFFTQHGMSRTYSCCCMLTTQIFYFGDKVKKYRMLTTLLGNRVGWFFIPVPV